MVIHSVTSGDKTQLEGSQFRRPRAATGAAPSEIARLIKSAAPRAGWDSGHDGSVLEAASAGQRP